MITMNLTRKSAMLGVAGVATVAALSGCSQVAALHQVSGVPVTLLSMASSYVLVDQKVPVMQFPTCNYDTDADTTITCLGTTTSGEQIKVTSPGSKSVVVTATPANGTATELASGEMIFPMKMTIGSKQVFEGDAQQVVNQAQGKGGQQ